MKRYRVLFGLGLLFWLGVWLFGSSNIGLYVAAALLLCLLLEGVAALKVRQSITVSLAAPASAAKGSAALLTVTVHNAALCGAAKVRVGIRSQNLLTGETEDRAVWLSVAGRTKADAVLMLDSSRCGKTVLTAAELAVSDAFGCFCLKKPAEASTAVLILPQLYPIQVSAGPHDTQDSDSTEYSMLRAGNDPGETFALREYRPGDRLRDIHWKLSEKTDQLTVREYGMPVHHAVLILLDNFCTGVPRPAALCEAIGEAAVSLSAALCEAGLPHDIGWYDAEKQAVSVLPVASEDALNAALGSILSARPTAGDGPIAECFCERYDTSCFAHILTVTDRERDEQILGSTAVSYWAPPQDRREGFYVEV